MEEIIQEEIEKDTQKVKVAFLQNTNENDMYHKHRNQSLVSYQFSDLFYHSISKCIRQQEHVLC